MRAEIPMFAVLFCIMIVRPSQAFSLSRSRREESFFDTPPETLETAIEKNRRNPLVCNSGSGMPTDNQPNNQATNAPFRRKPFVFVNSATAQAGQQPVPAPTSTKQRPLAPQRTFTRAAVRPQTTTPASTATASTPLPFIDFNSTDGVIVIMPNQFTPEPESSTSAAGITGSPVSQSDGSSPNRNAPNPNFPGNLIRRPTRPGLMVTTSTLPPFIDFNSTDGVAVILPNQVVLDGTSGQQFASNANFDSLRNSSFKAQGAATGDATADAASNLQSNQFSNQFHTVDGSVAQTGSHAAGTGSNVQLSGSSQAKSNGMADNQQQMVAVRTTDGNIILVPMDSTHNSPSDGTFLQTNNQGFQSAGNTVATGSGTVGTGSVSSNQDSQLLTNDLGTQSQSSNTGSGNGKDVLIKGAAVSSSNGQSSQQNWAENSQGIVGLQRGGSMWRQDSQQQNSQGKGGASGQAFAPDGSGSSEQNSQTFTDNQGTRVQSNSRSRATGRGVKISGASNSGGNQGGFIMRIPLSTSWSFAR
ncbi:uncharacterized protein LOC129602678 [Paramacrobiotus metropolitanus]|uniref:uncharacterized protein LOC129602678 n=1 Tax=Paramacrobiotus metropolitanus TaxID=2943436 RepID=UPI0024460A11|nr:uncharacterized protein LOC129602678 [Paramacrobiotus metropolitanus]